MNRLPRFFIILLMLLLFIGPASPAASAANTRYVVFEGFYRET